MKATLTIADISGSTHWQETWDAEGATLDSESVAREMEQSVQEFRDYSRPFKVGLLLDLPDRTVEWTWGLTEAKAEHFRLALSEHAHKVARQHEGNFTAHRYVLGPFRIFTAKEVGPPPWRWPHVGLWTGRWRLAGLVGWRSTAYRASIGWRRSTD